MLTIITPEWRHWRRSGALIVNFEQISYFFLEFLLLTFNKQIFAGLSKKNRDSFSTRITLSEF